MSMLEAFFSVDYAGRADLFEGLSIWEEEKYQKLQGTFPVISLSFANIKENNYIAAKEKIEETLTELYKKYIFLLESEVLTEYDKKVFRRILHGEMKVTEATSLTSLIGILEKLLWEESNYFTG